MLDLDDEQLFKQFELTYEGQPICINDYANWIAEESNTHVIHIDDSFMLKIEPERFVDYIQQDMLQEGGYVE